jgi:predicted Zn-dependent protease
MKKFFRQLSRLAMLSTLFLSACATNPATGKKVFDYYSWSDEVQLGQKTMSVNEQEMKKAGVPINQDRARLGQIEGIVRKITAISDNPQLPYTVTLFQTNIVNAAAAPGGAMMVFQGLYDPKVGLVSDENEMAAVLGHEIAHVNCRHVTRQMSIVMPLATAAEIGAEILASRKKESAAWILRGAFAVGTTLLIPAYSRSEEAEADHVGTLYMARAGYDPRAAPRIWKRAMDNAKGKHDSASIFATHPSDKARYEALVKLLPDAMEEYRKSTGHYPAGYDPDHPSP